MVLRRHHNLLKVEHRGSITVVELRLRTWTYDPLATNPSAAEEQVHEAIEEILRTVGKSEPLVVVNFQSVSNFSGSGLTPLVKMAMRIKQRNGYMVVCHLPQAIRDVASATRLGEVMGVHDTETDAVRALSSPAAE